MGVSGLLQNEIRQTDIEGLLKRLMIELAKLAPHPDRPDYTGPLFISVDSEFKPPAEYEGMLGSCLAEGFLQSQFFSAALDVLETGTSYLLDRSAKQSVASGQNTSISKAFNNSAQRAKLVKSYYRDLPKRMGMEAWIAHLQRRLYTLRRNELRLSLSFAA